MASLSCTAANRSSRAFCFCSLMVASLFMIHPVPFSSNTAPARSPCNSLPRSRGRGLGANPDPWSCEPWRWASGPSASWPVWLPIAAPAAELANSIWLSPPWAAHWPPPRAVQKEESLPPLAWPSGSVPPHPQEWDPQEIRRPPPVSCAFSHHLRPPAPYPRLTGQLLLWVIFTHLDPDPLTWLNPDPIRIQIRIQIQSGSGYGSGSATLV